MRHDHTLSERDIFEKLSGSTVNKENALSRSHASTKWKYLLKPTTRVHVASGGNSSCLRAG